MTDVSLEAMLRRAAQEAEKMFNRIGEIQMYWLVDTIDEGPGVLVTPVVGPKDVPTAVIKSEIAARVREEFKEKNVTRYVMVHEAWCLKTDTAGKDARDAKDATLNAIADAGGLIANMPERLEFVTFIASDGHEHLHGMREIIRPAGRKPYLGALDIDRPRQIEGLFVNMLPIENETTH
jgi:hypothetical protein